MAAFVRGIMPPMDDNTLRVRIAQSAGRNKLTLVVCALLVLVGLVGWLTTLS